MDLHRVKTTVCVFIAEAKPTVCCVHSPFLAHSELIQGFAESLQHHSSNQSEIVMIKLYCCGPDYCSIYPLLYYFFQIRHGLGSSVFKLCCEDSAKPCTVSLQHRLCPRVHIRKLMQFLCHYVNFRTIDYKRKVMPSAVAKILQSS